MGLLQLLLQQARQTQEAEVELVVNTLLLLVLIRPAVLDL